MIINQNNDDFFYNNYNTKLSPIDESKFLKFIIKNNKKNDLYDYDLRGLWLEKYKNNQNEEWAGHATDFYKKPNHPTFSNESKYHMTPHPTSGFWIGGEWQDDNSFIPSMQQATPENLNFLVDYFKKYEPESVLVTPSK